MRRAGWRNALGCRTVLLAAWGLGAAPAGAAVLRFEAETCSEPAAAWQADRGTPTHWNLWSKDTDAATKWSGGVVLQSPVVAADRGTPEEGAPPLHTRVTGLSNGVYDVSLRVGRTVAVSLDGRTWRRFTGGVLVAEARITNGVFSCWVDDACAHTGNPGHAYYDYIEFTTVPVVVPKPRVAGGARERVVEKLDRGLVAYPSAAGVYVGWRLLAADPPDVAFHVYRADGGAAPRRLTPEPVRRTTDFLDSTPPAAGATSRVYRVRRVAAAGRESADEGVAAVRADELAAPAEPAGRRLALAGAHTFQKCGLGDLDGDGRYDFVLKQPRENIDPYESYWQRSPAPYTLEAYRHDGTPLWQLSLGWAIERGIWYSPCLVYDFDGDGRAEVAVKTGDGDPRDPDGRVRGGAEWLSIREGATGRERVRVPWPDRTGFGEGLRGYNYASRNQLAVAYLDGRTPCLLALRGTYTIMKVEAYALRGDTLQPLWSYRDSEGGRGYHGQGCHFTHAADVDGDGRDEVVLGSAVLDDNGSPLWSTGLGHPDHCYVGDIAPGRPGLEIYYGIEPARAADTMCLVEAATGRRLWGWNQPTRHIHSQGLCADIDPVHAGAECYAADSNDHKPTGDRWLWSAAGAVLSREVDFKFGRLPVYWDADLQREILEGGNVVTDYEGGALTPRLRGDAILAADIEGDWREELIVSEQGALRVYATTTPALDRRVTLMQDPLYRLDVAMNALGYGLAPMTSYALEACAPNLNLTALARQPGAVRVVVSAPLQAPLRGALRLASAGATVAPDTLAVDLAPGERLVQTVLVARASSPTPADISVRAELAGDAVLLRTAVSVPGVGRAGGGTDSTSRSR